jgi:fimbrial chaperone protein
MGKRLATMGLTALAAAAWLPPATAGTFTISPLRVDLSRGAPSAALTVRNEEETAVVVQVETLQWTQGDGQDALDPSRDLIASPTVFTLAPQGTQLVRVALRRAPDATREHSYRLVLQEVPPAPAPDFTGLQVALRLSLPVFVAAEASSPPRLAWSAARNPDGGLTVTAQNTGSIHARILGFSVVPETGAAPGFDQPVASYLLPGASRSWRFGENTGAGAASAIAPRYRLRGRTDTGEFTAELATRQ